jgi:hypothetical protein
MSIVNTVNRDSEKYLEPKLKREVEKLGGYCRKYKSQSRRGAPDRIVIYQGLVFFIEVKSKGRKPSPLQIEEHAAIRAAGGTVRVIDRHTALLNFISFLYAL